MRCLRYLLLPCLVACSHDDGTAAAMRTMNAFQAALQRGDESACRELLTDESKPVLAEMPWDTVRARKPLQVLGAEPVPCGFHVAVADPNLGDARGTYVVAREFGRLVVDLVGTAELHTEVVSASVPREDFTPRELTAADFDRIRQYELSQPPK